MGGKRRRPVHLPDGRAAQPSGSCRPAVYATTAHWQAAADIFRLGKHVYGRAPCRLGFVYQAVRNVAAAFALVEDGQTAVFALVYDATNPYFTGAGEWPGWPEVLAHTLDDAHSQLRFIARSWQELMRELPLTRAAQFWASEKHGLD